MNFTSQDILQRVRAEQSITNTYAEVAMSTNLSIDRGYIWLIHKVLFWASTFALEEPAASATELYRFQLTRESKPATINTLNSADLIAVFQSCIKRSAAIGTDAGPLYWVTAMPYEITYPVPLAFAGNNLYFGVSSSNSGAVSFSVEVQIVLQKDKETDYFRIASALLLS